MLPRGVYKKEVSQKRKTKPEIRKILYDNEEQHTGGVPGELCSIMELRRESILLKGYKFLEPHLNVQADEAEYILEIK